MYWRDAKCKIEKIIRHRQIKVKTGPNTSMLPIHAKLILKKLRGNYISLVFLVTPVCVTLGHIINSSAVLNIALFYYKLN